MKSDIMQEVLSIQQIVDTVTPIARKYQIESVYLFGSYARGCATADSDLDFIVFGGPTFKLTMIFAFAEELRAAFQKDIDVFEIHEVNRDSAFYTSIMNERLLVA